MEYINYNAFIEFSVYGNTCIPFMFLLSKITVKALEVRLLNFCNATSRLANIMFANDLFRFISVIVKPEYIKHFYRHRRPMAILISDFFFTLLRVTVEKPGLLEKTVFLNDFYQIFPKPFLA